MLRPGLPAVDLATGPGGGGNPVWAIGLAALLLTWPAMWNGYPLVFADTGTYLGQALLVYVAGTGRPSTASSCMRCTGACRSGRWSRRRGCWSRICCIWCCGRRAMPGRRRCC
ncbi:hypothetical protein ACFQY5_00565 [Paeniroseomonas aquatica]|uniref:hypothetical protein n=1 Tax=Paeniroseomonas aquatica TaxID=373043 RepID=UPI003618BF7B